MFLHAPWRTTLYILQNGQIRINLFVLLIDDSNADIIACDISAYWLDPPGK